MQNKINLFNNFASFSIGDPADNYSLGTVTGWATKYYNPADPGTNYQITENISVRFAKDCFSPDLFANHNHTNDIKIFVNHQMDAIPFARTASGTAKVWLEGEGIRYSFSVPKTSAGEQLLTAIARKDIVGSSFTGAIAGNRWSREGNQQVKTITKFAQIVEISPCYDPAFSATNGLTIAASLNEEAKRVLEIQARIAKARE